MKGSAFLKKLRRLSPGCSHSESRKAATDPDGQSATTKRRKRDRLRRSLSSSLSSGLSSLASLARGMRTPSPGSASSRSRSPGAATTAETKSASRQNKDSNSVHAISQQYNDSTVVRHRVTSATRRWWEVSEDSHPDDDGSDDRPSIHVPRPPSAAMKVSGRWIMPPPISPDEVHPLFRSQAQYQSLPSRSRSSSHALRRASSRISSVDSMDIMSSDVTDESDDLWYKFHEYNLSAAVSSCLYDVEAWLDDVPPRTPAYWSINRDGGFHSGSEIFYGKVDELDTQPAPFPETVAWTRQRRERRRCTLQQTAPGFDEAVIALARRRVLTLPNQLPSAGALTSAEHDSPSSPSPSFRSLSFAETSQLSSRRMRDSSSPRQTRTGPFLRTRRNGLKPPSSTDLASALLSPNTASAKSLLAGPPTPSPERSRRGQSLSWSGREALRPSVLRGDGEARSVSPHVGYYHTIEEEEADTAASPSGTTNLRPGAGADDSRPMRSNSVGILKKHGSLTGKTKKRVSFSNSPEELRSPEQAASQTPTTAVTHDLVWAGGNEPKAKRCECWPTPQDIGGVSVISF